MKKKEKTFFDSDCTLDETMEMIYINPAKAKKTDDPFLFPIFGGLEPSADFPHTVP